MFKTMIAILEGTKAALSAIKANALRSALTCLGIIIGVAAVITVVAVMQGFTKQINDQLADMSPDVTSIKPVTTNKQKLLGQRAVLTYQDFEMLKNKVDGFETITAMMMAWRFSGAAEYKGNSHASRVLGTEANYQKAYRIYPEVGRFIRTQDDEKRRRVAFIGPSIIEKLKLPTNPVGEYIKLGGEWFRIIGVAEKQGSFLGFDQDDYINIPISTMQLLEGNEQAPFLQIMFRLEEDANEAQTTQLMRRILRQQHQLQGDEIDDFEFETAEKARQSIDKFTGSATAITAGIVGISLLVGGIGVMNIMLVSVTERTRIIGTLKALGATPGFIMLQFLVEAVVLSLFGGIIGLIIGYGAAVSIAAVIPGMPGAYIPPWAVMLSFGFTSLIGVIFGLAPAIKAARLNPIDALRYE